MNGYPTYAQPPLFPQPSNSSHLSSDLPPTSAGLDGVNANMGMDMHTNTDTAMGMGMGFGGMQHQQQQPQQQQQQQRTGRPAQSSTDDGDKVDRRKSLPAYANMAMHMDNSDSRRFSLLNFGGDANNAVNLDAFSFNDQTAMMQPPPSFSQPASAPAFSINAQFAAQNQPLASLQTPASAFSSPQYPIDSLSIGTNPSFVPDFSMSMDLQMENDALFQDLSLTTPLMDSTLLDQEFMDPGSATLPLTTGPQPLGSYANSSLPNTADINSSLPNGTNSGQQTQPNGQVITPTRFHDHSGHVSPFGSGQERPIAPAQDVPVADFAQMSLPWTAPPGGFPSTMNNNPHMSTQQFQNAYSKTGFDMLGILSRVATRPNPQIDLGQVDLSCAFVVCDAQAEDCPIVYCSDNFGNLTGYNLDEIRGQNCRFLQSPEGKVEQGTRRKYCDDRSVRALREAVDNFREAQVSLINYRKGGQPFMNLLTMIPISWEVGGPVRYFVGFQVDLVEQPNSVITVNTDGTHKVSYQRPPEMPRYLLGLGQHDTNMSTAQEDVQSKEDVLGKQDVAAILASHSAIGSDEGRRRIWEKMLVENTSDVVFVLSLKGVFLYLNPASSRMLEYDPGELTLTGISSVCHPSDIVPVTRELKEATAGSFVNIVFRLRRKVSGYMWFEGLGGLVAEQGKGRKFIILVGRSRPVYTLSKSVVRAAGGIGDSELWTKMSTTGMFLFVSGNVRALLDRHPEELVGTSIQALMRPESKQDFGRMLEAARTGRTGGVKHEIMNRKGQALQAYTTVYPGDAVEGQKPTFLIAQTRLLKYSRGAKGQRVGMFTGKEPHSADLRGSARSLPAQVGSSAYLSTGANTPLSNGSDARFSMGAPFPGPNRLPTGPPEDNIFDELKTTKSSNWQFELRQMERRNRQLAEQVQGLLAAKKKRKRRKGAAQKDCANCHTTVSPEWRRGPSGNRDLCNSCGLRYAKQVQIPARGFPLNCCANVRPDRPSLS
ncbi:uncharacterized protein EI97DRAFT_210109 [Westerdykella ornata]|uniref:White collar 1 protein n=1 Tax=Westerdykella ornata TaxID=318751 RepID=A0A6A6J7R9_WESOR|nr:uncharacterized protein EI97DRAFT_210109 [Westerdykella ornata]KAF2272445.1 hypothetical protein EI97DRAFT_210109 [Westerdykella ornata]